MKFVGFAFVLVRGDCWDGLVDLSGFLVEHGIGLEVVARDGSVGFALGFFGAELREF